MNDANLYLMLATEGLVALAMVVVAGLVGWRSWLAFKRQELGLSSGAAVAGVSAGARIEIADLKERIRKLEAIAAGVEL